MSETPLFQMKGIKKYFPMKDGFKTRYVKAVDGVTLNFERGVTMGLVGESGCGKSTLGRVALKLIEPTEGESIFRGEDIYRLKSRDLIGMRRHMQFIFQDPLASLNPQLRVRQIIEEPLRFHSKQMKINMHDRKLVGKLVTDALGAVGLPPEIANRYPHEFSGGQQQRIGIARALILRPDFIVCDEMVSALDVSVQAQVLNLLQDLKEEYHLTYLFISHNLSVIKHVCDQIAVMYLGKVVELADNERLFSNPLHPYTKALISAIPIPDPDIRRNRILLEGDLPSPMNPPSGCRFHTRCNEAVEECSRIEPEFKEIEPGHFVACCKYSDGGCACGEGEKE
ncbi:ABC transporter ATP-binding protein [Christensenella intestinihominis]|uniref:ABC transporter ATP-binding protein n=1 Tax=Christensenella intestinihominis TaxID=1851429 RepID=UPI000837A2EC|nr:oligopeptide/dipeptide ABC transporter ATP-binding protein [Christensenella intestinihominis]